MSQLTTEERQPRATVGLMADPGVPRRVAVSIADDLAEDLGRDLGGLWRVEVDQETLPLGPAGEIRLTEHAPRLRRQHGWDFVIYLTDLATYPDGVPVLYDVSDSTAAALVCVPALGMWRVRSKTRALAAELVRSGAHSDGMGAPGTRDLPPAVRSGWLGRARLLGGMVLGNRPTRLVTALTGVVAAGAGSGAFGIFYGSIASLAAALHPLRLLLISMMGVLTLATWLIVRNGLWTRSTDELAPGSRRMDNAATVMTVGIGVGIMFLALLVAMFILAITVMDAGYLETQLERPAGIRDYVHLAWLSSCLGAFAGALGSNFDHEDSVRAATYSLRWHERRMMFDSYQDSESDSEEQQEHERIERENTEQDENSEPDQKSEPDEGAEPDEGPDPYDPPGQVEDDRPAR